MTTYTDEETGQRYAECWYCGKPIYIADQSHCGDMCYEVEGALICEDCLVDYMNDNYRKEAGADGEL